MEKCKYCDGSKRLYLYAPIENKSGERVHPDCGLNALGVDFFDEFTPRELFRQMPLKLVAEHDLAIELSARVRGCHDNFSK